MTGTGAGTGGGTGTARARRRERKNCLSFVLARRVLPSGRAESRPRAEESFEESEECVSAEESLDEEEEALTDEVRSLLASLH